MGDILLVQPDNIAGDQTVVATADTVAFNAVIHCGTDNCADTGVHTGGVAAAGQHTDSFYTHVLFLLS